MVTFETKCWERDWEFLLKTDHLKKMIDICDYSFKEKVLYINNVNDLSDVCKYADKFVSVGVIDRYVVVQDYIFTVLDFFNLNKDSFGQGFYYSIQELTGIFLCSTPYLLHFSSDSILENKFNWVDKAIDIMGTSSNIVVANPLWYGRVDEAKQVSPWATSDFWFSFGFSDQCYLIKTHDFKKPIYNEKNVITDYIWNNSASHGGELFEKRVDAWMRNFGRYRITYKHGSYSSKNWY